MPTENALNLPKLANRTRRGQAAAKALTITILWLLAGWVFFQVPTASATLPIQHWQTDAGSHVYFVENHDLPILDLSIDFPAGSSANPREQSGLANLTRQLLPLGAGGLTEDQIATQIADVGAVLGDRFDADRAGITVRTLSSERQHAMNIFKLIVQQPEFPQAVVEREKARITAIIKDSDTKPGNVADKAFYRMLYGDHPYALRPLGEVESVSSLTRKDLVDFYRTHYGARGAVVAIMGDITRSEAENIAEQLTKGLPSENSPDSVTTKMPPVQKPVKAILERIAHPATQSHILLGYPGMRRGDPDYYALYVGNYILGGGGFVSRLMEEVRERRGLAYSVYSYFNPLKLEGPFQVGLQTKREQTDEALQVVRRAVNDFIASGPTEQELKAAKQHIIGGFPLRIDSNKDIHEYLAIIGFYGLPLTYLDDFVRNVGKVTVADVKSAFRRRIDPDRMVTVVVGSTDAAAQAASGVAK